MISRRTYLTGMGLLAAGGGSVLAGCAARAQAPPSETPETRMAGGLVPVEPDYEGWFKGVSNYDGTIDRRDQEFVSVTVGEKGNLGAFAFGPAAVAVSPGATVVWEWTGNGGGHDVASAHGFFSSGGLADEPGHTFEYTFETPGVFPYYCTPHRTMGMRGAVVVALGSAGTL